MKVDESIFKAYDIRGTYPDQLNDEVAYKIAQGYAKYVVPQGEVLVGRDVRLHSQAIQQSLLNGLSDAGVNAVDIGLTTSDMYYFSVGFYQLAGGLQATASHNPPEWHGVKMVREDVKPLTLERGISQIKDFAVGVETLKKTPGKIRALDTTSDYCSYILKWIDITKIKPMKVVYNANFGYAGKIFETLVKMGKLPITLVPLNSEPDGNFPKGRPDPFIPENRPEFIELVKSTGANFGVTWDADADRCFFCADGGVFLEPYHSNTLLIKKMLAKYPGGKIIYDPRYTWALIDSIKESGGTPVICRVGHSYIKEKMREEDAIFATESSGHTYYRNFWYADSGMIPVVQIMELLSESTEKLSDLIRPVLDKYYISGEINNTVAEPKAKMEEIAKKYSDGEQSTLDGITVEYPDFRFNVRSSNTEAFLRLNLEAKSKELMEQNRDEILQLIKS